MEYGDPIFEDTTWSLFTEDREMLEENWNEHRDSTHPLSNVSFCYVMHCIVFHSQLFWEDILSIDDVRLNMNIEYQMLTNDKIKKELLRTG